MSSRIGVDIGGTFTDFIIYDEEKNSVTIDKIPTTPDTPEKAVVEVIKRNLNSPGHRPSGRVRPSASKPLSFLG